MRKNYLFSYTIAVIVLSGCMSSTQLRVLQPADITVSENIKTIAVVNRSRPEKKGWNALEDFLTGEDIGMDRIAAQRAVEGITAALTRTPRFNVKQTDLEMKGTGGNYLPEPLTWQEVEKICATYQTDAVLALESFDSDVDLNFKINNISSKDKAGNKIVVPEHQTNLSLRVKTGWRLYNSPQKNIEDQFHGLGEKNWETKGKTKEEAIAKLPSKQGIVNDVSYSAGYNYGVRIAPMWANIQRFYYTKGDDKMKEAEKLVVAGEWKQAAAIWQMLLKKGDVKLAGRAAYNMAIVNEVEGNLEVAKEWAEKAYTEFKNKRAKQYMFSLEQRIRDKAKLKEQMKEE